MQPFNIPEWKWEEIGMDFITGLPLTPKKKDMIWVIVDRLTKSAHFLAFQSEGFQRKTGKSICSRDCEQAWSA
jgi:hypothetical protein